MTRSRARVASLYLLLGAAACDGGSEGRLEREEGTEPNGAEADAGEAAPADCAHEIALAPAAGGFVASGTVADLEVAGAGVDLCLHLDGTANARNHFMSGTDQEDGEASSFILVLVDQDGAVLHEGWDVTFGTEDPRTFASLEWAPWAPDVPQGEHVADVILRVSTRDGTAHTTSIDVALFDPLE